MTKADLEKISRDLEKESILFHIEQSKFSPVTQITLTDLETGCSASIPFNNPISADLGIEIEKVKKTLTSLVERSKEPPKPVRHFPEP